MHVHVTLNALDVGVLAGQRKGKGRVVENILRKPIHPVVAGHTVVAQVRDMSGDEIGLVIAMAGLTECPVKMRQVFDMAIRAGKRLARGRHPVSRERKAQYVVWKVLKIHACERGLWTFMLGVTTAAQ